MTRQKIQRELELDFGDGDIILSNTYKRSKRDAVSFIEQATYLIENNYPVPSTDVNVLAEIMQENFDRRLDEEKRKEYDIWKKQQELDSN